MLALAVAALLASTPVQTQDPASSPAAPRQDLASTEPVVLEDVEVTGASVDSQIGSFVMEVAAPNRFRGLARWNDEVCVYVAGLPRETAQLIVDRVSTVVEALGLKAGAPGCQPNVFVLAADDPDQLAARLVRNNRELFRPGGTGEDRGRHALWDFVHSDRPVRWWHVSAVVDSSTDQPPATLLDECIGPCAGVPDTPITNRTVGASRLASRLVDHLSRTFVILGAEPISRISASQLANYLAMVSMAQIDPEADTRRYPSILNVFETPDSAPGLTDWDMRYLSGLYGAERRRRFRVGRSQVIEEIRRAHQRSRERPDD